MNRNWWEKNAKEYLENYKNLKPFICKDETNENEYYEIPLDPNDFPRNYISKIKQSKSIRFFEEKTQYNPLYNLPDKDENANEEKKAWITEM